MKLDYHQHLEYGSYELDYAQGFLETAKERGLVEIGFSEHTHTFVEFEHFYYDDLILDDSFIGSFQQKWLKKNKFKYTVDDYFAFMEACREHFPVKTGIEVCNFQDQQAVGELLGKYDFDYIIGSVHFLRGWAYDSSEIKAEWDRRDLRGIYEQYTEEAEALCAAGHYDMLGHPFNIRLYQYFPDFDVTPYLQRVVEAMRRADMVVDVNTGTLYRYPVKEISPYGDFMRLAHEAGLPVTINSDAHRPTDSGAYHDMAVEYVRDFGYTETVRFTKRKREIVPLS
ncbi:histidinol phosphate phosphatase domain-containing protein [Selenomonas sp. TAMA-11512]|uniref:histidinol-phosphatase n=1 Tax=Selenomonas sp. TAMA-11512 TaxID=3095337 RepID=UPI003087C8FD|nr:histidinol phosphate phosphatase domain-containing protein [Selenomonas sp. TAMA-11512]